MNQKCFIRILLQAILLISDTNQDAYQICDHNCSVINNGINEIIAMNYIPGMIIFVTYNKLFSIYPVIIYNNFAVNYISFDSRLPDMYVIFLENYKIEQIFNNFESRRLLNTRAYFIIIISQSIKNVNELLIAFANYFVYKVVVINSNGSVISFDSFRQENIDLAVRAPVLEDSIFSNKSAIWSKTYPLTWRNTTLKTIYSAHFPYLFIYNNKLVGENYEYNKILQSKLQFKQIILEREKLDASKNSSMLG